MILAGTHCFNDKPAFFVALTALSTFFEVDRGILQSMFVVHIVNPASDTQLAVLCLQPKTGDKENNQP